MILAKQYQGWRQPLRKFMQHHNGFRCLGSTDKTVKSNALNASNKTNVIVNIVMTLDPVTTTTINKQQNA